MQTTDSSLAGMAKQQTGLRIQHVLFKQFQDLCRREKLRPGEAAESLIQNAVDLRSVVAVSLNIARPNNPGRIIDQMLFRSRLSRMKTVLEQERKYHEIVGTMLGHGIGGHLYALETELAELGRKSIDEELVQEFEALLTEFDKLYADVEKSQNENRIKNHRR